MPSSLEQLMDALRVEVAAVQQRAASVPVRKPLPGIFRAAVQKTMAEIKHGADSDSFPDLVVINFLLGASKEGYESSELKDFMDTITNHETPPED